MSKVSKVCPQCKKIFWVAPSNAHRYTYCSVECRKAAKNKEYTCPVCGKIFTAPISRKNVQCCSPECSAQFRSTKEIRICKYCGKEFIVNKSSKKLCCSDECQKSWRKKIGMAITKCTGCGKEIEVPNRRIERGEHCYCSSECAAEHAKTGSWDVCSNCGSPV